MATKYKKNSEGELDGSPFSFGIVVAEWNAIITERLLQGAIETFHKAKVNPNKIKVIKVPGSVELTKGAQWLAETEKYDAIICLGCVIQGETKHFDYVCQSVTFGITELNLLYDIPFIFGVLTTLNEHQAIERAGGIYGNKGSECAEVAIKMLRAKEELK